MITVFKIAWGNTFRNAGRTLAAVGGITFSILLIFLQLGFLQAAKTQVTLLFDHFDFDIAIVDQHYQILATAPHFDRRRLIQAAVDPDIADTFRLNVTSGRWVDPQTEIESSMLIIGLDEKPTFIADAALRHGIAQLKDSRSVMLDSFSSPDYGSLSVGDNGMIGFLNTEVTSLFQLGLFFYAEGSVATNNDNYVRFSGRSANDVTLGLLKTRDGADPDVVAQRIRALVPNDVVVMTRDGLISEEQGYFISVKPIGIMFQSAVFVAFIVGLVILFQVLATELNNRMHEYATMKAMGFGSRFVYGIGITQNIVFIALSFLPAFAIATGLFRLVYDLSRFPTHMTAQLAITVFLLTVAMGIVAGGLAMRRLGSADPVDLF